jgi:hypothetical protein
MYGLAPRSIPTPRTEEERVVRFRPRKGGKRRRR